MPQGLIAAALAYIMWGLFPLYIKQVAHVNAAEVVAHRSAWSLVFVFALLAWTRRLGWLKAALADARVLRIFGLSAVLLAVNWGLYVWAVSAGRILDASLGYFINPLVNVVLGVLVGGVLLQRPGQTPESGTVVALESVPAATTVPVAAEAPGVARAVSSDRVAAVPAPDMATAVRSAPPAPAPATAGAATATAPGPTPAPVRAKAAAVAPSDTVAVAASPTAPVESATAPLADTTAALPPAARVQAQTLEPLQSFTEAATVEALRTSLQLLVEQTRGTWRTAPWDGAASVVPVPNTTTLTLRSPPRPPPAALASSLAPLELTLSDSRGTATLRLDADGLSLCRTDEVPCWRAPLSPEQRDAVAQRWRAMQR